MAGIDDLLHTGGALKGALARDALDEAGAPQPLTAGDRVGAFRIVGELGRGGMGVVYEAERVDGAFEQHVAIKWLLARGGAAHAAQFRRERQILAALRHPHIARLLDGGEASDGTLWFAMERIEGTPIDRYCAERGTGLRGRVDLFAQVCEAVAFAHARLLVHRDIKPSNILIDSDGSAKLVDFGIAHVLDDGSVAMDACTPGFASPEQAAGAPSSIAADIYSLGILLRSLLHPKRLTDDRDEDVSAAYGLNPAPELLAIADCAAARDAARRYATVEALLADVRRYHARQPVIAYGGGGAYRAARFVQRHWAATAVAAIALILITGLSIAFIGGIRAQRDQAELEAQKANAVTEFVVDLLRSANPSVHRGDKLSVIDVIARGEGKADAELADQPDVHARLLSALADVQLSLSNYAEALRLNERAVAIMRELPEKPHVQIAQRLRTAAQSAWRLGDYARRLELIDEAQNFNLGANRDAYNAVSLMRTRANLLRSLGRRQEGEQAADEAVRIARTELAPGSPILGRALIGAALHDEARGDYTTALQKAREAAGIFLAAPSHGDGHPDTFVARGNISLYLLELDQSRAAGEQVEANLAVMLRVLGEDHANTLRQSALSARIALSNGDPVLALRRLETVRRGMSRIEHLDYQAWLDAALAEAELALREARPRDALVWFEKLDNAAKGGDRDAALGVVQAHCLLGTQARIASRMSLLDPLAADSPRLARLRTEVRTQCKVPMPHAGAAQVQGKGSP